MTFARTLLLGTALAFGPLAVTPALAQEKPIAEIDVTADFSRFEGANALDYYPDLQSDLKSELSEELAGQMTDEGGRLQVIVSEVSVDGDVLLEETTPFNRISAGVFYYEPQDNVLSGSGDDPNPVPETSTVTVAAVADESSVPEDATGFIIQPADDADVYAAMVDGLAKMIAREVTQM